ncbi:MAG: YbhB/YbcL family Raf kinase inhibitor-like protein [Cellvibrionales bacterium]|nr:YbhB/YbcL family Raf kinase inhibitor-like protein [Cellvibrionales bacterium]
MSKTHEFNGFGCTGEDKSPELSWSDAPNDTKAFALMVHDADAPTDSSWWHWQVINIPASVNKLAQNAGHPKNNQLPKGSIQITNDYGIKGFGGACPPKGHGIHHYRFTLYALKTPLNIPKGASSALVSFQVKANAIDSTTLEALYKR